MMDTTDATVEAILAEREGYTKPIPKRGGRPRNVAVARLSTGFGVSARTVRKSNPHQLMQCKDDAAKRLLLGISK
jgi:hypothetical protein